MKIPSKYQKLAATAITLCFAAMITIVLGQGFQDSIPEVVWTMVNVNHAEQQGDAHLIQVKQGKTVLIDAGYLQPAEQQLVPFLQNHKINHLDLVFVSHAHRDIRV